MWHSSEIDPFERGFTIAGESEHYKPLFPECELIGLDYQTFTPWETGEEIREAVTKLKAEYDSVTLIGNSIGAFFSMNARINAMIRCAYFISPVVDMEQLILNMMSWAGATEKELKEKGLIPTSLGEDLSAVPGSTVLKGLATRGNDCQNKQDSVRKSVNDWITELGF